MAVVVVYLWSTRPKVDHYNSISGWLTPKILTFITHVPFVVTVGVVVVVVVVVVVGQSDISHNPASVEFPGQFS